MAKDEKPLEYQGRIRDTKGRAQRIDLEYLRHPERRGVLLRRLSWIALALSAVLLVPLFLGYAGGRRAFSSGPVSRAHATVGDRCESCHTKAFSAVPDAACRRCHDGPAHPAKAIDTARSHTEVRCAQCHLEHRGNALLADVDDRNCTACHANLQERAAGVRISATKVTKFRRDRHPEFAAAMKPDDRPLKFKHAGHMPNQTKVIKGVTLPVACSKCHETDRLSSKGDLLPVTFDRNCIECHKGELDFNVYGVLGPGAAPAPHNKDPKRIHQIIEDAYDRALEADPRLALQPLGREEAVLRPSEWLARIVAESEQFVYKKCAVCHVVDSMSGPYPEVAKTREIRGRFVADKQSGEPWFTRGEFSHRAHRTLLCDSCHTTARRSVRAQDVLVPQMNTCLSCHGNSGTHIDRCAECHLYHNKFKESDKDRLPIDQLIGRLSGTV
jgi:hypothetical protein